MSYLMKRAALLLCCLTLSLCMVSPVSAAAPDYDALYNDYSALLVDAVVAKSGDMDDEEREALFVRWDDLQASLDEAAESGDLSDEQLDVLDAISIKIYTELVDEPPMAALMSLGNAAEDEYSVPLMLAAQAVPFSVTVPSSIAISVNESGVATAADFTIANHSVGDVCVSSLAVSPEGEWQLKPYGTIFDVNEKSFALKINNDDVSDGFDASVAGVIAVDDTLTLPVAASVATQTAGYSGTIGNIVFVMNWVENGPVVDIEITEQPTKTTYSAGETFDATGMVVTAIYADGTGEDVTNAVTVDTTTPLTYGTSYVNVSYSGITKSVNVSVGRTLASIAVTTQPTKTTYSAGETFDATGMVVTAIYADGDTAAVANYTCAPSDALSADDTEVTITYTEGGITKTAAVTISVKQISAMEAASIGSVVTAGTFKINGTAYGAASLPQTYSGSNTYAFDDSDSDSSKNLQWVKVSDTLFIADRNLLTNISWNNIDSLGFLNGSNTVTIEGNTYKIRLLTGGTNYVSGWNGGTPTDNEWDTYISGYNGSTPPAGSSDDIWHWSGIYSWCSETTADGDSDCRPIRGSDSAAGWNCDAASDARSYCGFRPALELVE